MRNYYADELVSFVKYTPDKSNSGRYLYIGYLNKDKTRFKDIVSGEVYPLTCCRVEINSARIDVIMAIEIEGQLYFMNDMREKQNENGGRYMAFANKCVFSQINREPFMVIRGKVGYPYLYHFIGKKNDVLTRGVVSGEVITRATKEADAYAENWLYKFNEFLADEKHKVLTEEGYPSLTEEERDF